MLSVSEELSCLGKEKQYINKQYLRKICLWFISIDIRNKREKELYRKHLYEYATNEAFRRLVYSTPDVPISIKVIASCIFAQNYYALRILQICLKVVKTIKRAR